MSNIRSRLLAAAETDGRIDRIEPHPRDPNFRRIIVSERAAAQLTSAEVDELAIEAGQRWNATLRRRVERTVARSVIQAKAMSILGRRALSRAVLRDRLLGDAADAETVDTVLDDLADAGWLDDATLADAVVHDLTQSKPAGERLVRERLASRGVDAATIDRAVKELNAAQNPADAALEFARTQQKKLARTDSRTAARRLAGQLHRRGFDEETIEHVLEQLGYSTDDDDAEAHSEN